MFRRLTLVGCIATQFVCISLAPDSLAAQTPRGPWLCPAVEIPPATKFYPVPRRTGSGNILFGNVTKLTRDSWNPNTGESWYITTPAAPTTQYIQDTIWKWQDAEVHAVCQLYEYTVGSMTLIDSSLVFDYPGGEAIPLSWRTEEDTCIYEMGCDEEGDGGGSSGGGGGGGPEWQTCVYTVYVDTYTGQEIYRTLDYCYYW